MTTCGHIVIRHCHMVIKDKMSVEAYLQITQMSSQGPPAGRPGVAGTEKSKIDYFEKSSPLLNNSRSDSSIIYRYHVWLQMRLKANDSGTVQWW